MRKLRPTQVKKARNLATKSIQDVIVCENHGTIKIISTSDYIKYFLAIYEIRATITPTGQVIWNKHYN